MAQIKNKKQINNNLSQNEGTYWYYKIIPTSKGGKDTHNISVITNVQWRFETECDYIKLS